MVRAGGVDLVEVAPNRAGGVDRDSKLDCSDRVDLVGVAPNNAEDMDRNCDFVVIDSEGAEVEEEASLVFERLRGGSFGTEGGGSGTP